MTKATIYVGGAMKRRLDRGGAPYPATLVDLERAVRERGVCEAYYGCALPDGHNPALGRDCAASRPPSRPLVRPFHEKQHDLPLLSCLHKRPHSRWETCLAARNAAAARSLSMKW